MTAATSLIALADVVAATKGGVLLLSPAVGILRGVPAPGRTLSGGEAFARLTILGRHHPLLVPEELSGIVADLAVNGFGADAIAVEFRQPLLTLAPIAAAGAAAPSRTGPYATQPRKALHPGPGDLPAGSHAVLSPADGVFYRRARPTDPPYVETGARVRPGQTLALIEAMKCFSAITYGGGALPEEAEVLEIRAEDAAEVRHGQVLFVVR
jgi:acetyl-CoA carboxylase biotin carboxyl carrier protein